MGKLTRDGLIAIIFAMLTTQLWARWMTARQNWAGRREMMDEDDFGGDEDGDEDEEDPW